MLCAKARKSSPAKSPPPLNPTSKTPFSLKSSAAENMAEVSTAESRDVSGSSAQNSFPSVSSCSNSPTELIRLEKICKTYHRGTLEIPVLQGVTLTIARGELLALVGASGSGKSTLMNILG